MASQGQTPRAVGSATGGLGIILVLVVVGAWALGNASCAQAATEIDAAGGGPLETRGQAQRPAYAENTMPALRRSAERGVALGLDVRLTADGVPVLLRDETLDRTTSCRGPVAAIGSRELGRRCRVNVLGTAEVARSAPGARRARVPRLAAALRLARRAGATVVLGVGGRPGESAPGPQLVARAMAAVGGSGIPTSRVVVQSHRPGDLDRARREVPGASTSLVTTSERNGAGPALAKALGHDWVAPAWPVDQGYVSRAHALGLRVAPHTLESAVEVATAAGLGVDAVASSDPVLARRAIRATAVAEPPMPPPPSRRECRGTHADRTVRPAIAPVRFSDRRERRATPRVFAMQAKHELRHVETHESFRTKIECMIRHYVVPRLAPDRPNVVAFNEDIGLMTMATGSRGRPTRRIFGDSSLAPSCESIGVPCGVLGALAAIRTSYTREIAAYTVRFPQGPPIGMSFVAATDTFARGWMRTFSDMAKRYGVYILGSNIQAPFRESRDPLDIQTFADPDAPRPDSVFVATEPHVYNEGFIWGPDDVRREGPSMMRNVVARNKKVPVTQIEELIEVQPGPTSGPDAVENLRPYRLPGTRARLGFARSLPAFVYGHRIDEPRPRGIDPCSDTSLYYMRCLDRLGTNVVIQDEANPARWAGPSGEGNWQPLEWMRSTWRAVADPSVGFLYNVTPHLVGNLADLVFDGQTAITQRGLRGRRCTYVGNRSFEPGDPEYLRPYARPRRGFVGLVPWVAGSPSREELAEVSRRLAPGSGDALENDYLETAIVADLPIPPRPGRRACVGVRGQ